MTEIRFSRRAAKELEGLERQIKKRVLEKLKKNAENPLERSTKLTNSKVGTYRYRISDYRVIFDLDGDTLIVLRIGHRRDVYS